MLASIFDPFRKAIARRNSRNNVDLDGREQP
jgi:hypothetical protein